MTLYVPAHFAATDTDALARLMHDHPFATLITPAGGELHVAHVPLLHVRDGGPHGTLLGHFARANPQWSRGACLHATKRADIGNGTLAVQDAPRLRRFHRGPK